MNLDDTIVIDEMPTVVANLIDGTPKDDVLFGDARSNSIDGKGGDDQLIGFDHFDFLSGGQGNDDIVAGGGDDHLLGDRGNDFLTGGHGTDNLKGNQGRDLLQGNGERDFLRGGKGEDFLFGNEESDVFILQPGKGTDVIADFEDGIDRLGLFPDLSFDELEISQVGENTAIGSGDEVFALLSGIDANSIAANDFAEVVIGL